MVKCLIFTLFPDAFNRPIDFVARHFLHSAVVAELSNFLAVFHFSCQASRFTFAIHIVRFSHGQVFLQLVAVTFRGRTYRLL